jgi:hypothetical protein
LNEEVELLAEQLTKLRREKICLDNKMFEVLNDFSGIQRSLVPSVNLTTTDNMNRRLEVIEELVTKFQKKNQAGE